MTPKQEMNQVFRSAAEFAFDELAKHHEFLPFAVVITKTGELRFMQLGPDQVAAEGLANLDALRRLLRAEAHKHIYRSVAVASDVRIRMHDTGEIVDAVRVEMEHVAASPAAGVLPYRFVGDEIDQPIEPYFEESDVPILTGSGA